jgi:hypothetical protein
MMLTVIFTEIYPIQTSVAASPPTLDTPYPSLNGNGTYNPRLRIWARDTDSDSLTVHFRTNASGSWETLGTYNGSGSYTQYFQNTSNMIAKNTRYYWSVNATDGTLWKNGSYNFIAQPFLPKWRYYAHTDNNSIGPLSWDINNDGYDEIFMTGQNWTTKTGKAFCINGKTGTLIWSYNHDDIDFHSPFELGDLNNDGIPEMVISGNETFWNNGKTIALHADTGEPYWIANQESGGKYIAIVDTDGTGYPYVYICSGDFYHAANGNGRLRKLRGTTGEVVKQTFLYRPCWGGISVADADNDGRIEIYVNERKANYNSYEMQYDPENDTWTRVPVSLGQLNLGMMCYDADTLDLLWYQDAITASSHPVELIDVNSDGVLDAVSLQQNGGGVYVVDGATWDKIPGYYQDRITGLSPHSPFPLYDIDNDGKIEIIVTSEGPARMWDLGVWNTYLTIGSSNYSEPPKMVNVIGDEHLEIIGLSTGAKVYDPYGNLIETIPTCYGHDTPLVQDIDNDWQNELIVLSGDGQLQCYETSAYAPTTRIRSNVQLYSEQRTGVGIYIPPPGAPQPIIKTVSPANDAQDVTLNPTLRTHIIDYHHDLMNIVISTNASGSWEDLETYTNVGNSWHNLSTSTMNVRNTTYYWRITAVDPAADNITTTQTYHFRTLTSPQISNIAATPADVTPGSNVNITADVIDGTKVNTVKINIRAPNGDLVANATASGGTPEWTTLRYDTFESGMGSYTDGGDSCSLYNGNVYAPEGSKAVRLEGYDGLDSSFYLTQPINVHTPGYTKIKVDFMFIADGMSNLSNFWVKFYDGQHWRIVDNYIKPGAQGYRPTDRPFENGTFYHAITWINESKYTFPTDMKIRFECDADPSGRSNNTIYIDRIYINASAAQGLHYYVNRTYTQLGTYQYFIWAVDNKTNSIRSTTQTFKVSTNPQPYQPDDPDPTNGSTNVQISKDLSWTGGDPNGNVTYDVYFGTSNQPPLVAENRSSTSYDPGTMGYSTTYYWRILAYDSQNVSTVGPLWHFKTVAQPQPPSDGGPPEPPEPKNKEPVAKASTGQSYVGNIGEAILFNGSLSSDQDGSITTWFWTFGDNTNGTGKTVTHTYIKVGTYNVTLKVTDNGGKTQTNTTTCTILQPNRPPTTPIITGPINGTTNTTYAFTAVATDLDNDTIRYRFTWGDTTSIDNESSFMPSNTSFTCSHSWSTPGQYIIMITASDNQTESTTQYSITIQAEPKETGPTPGFELIVLICALSVAILLWKKKRKV